MLTPDEAARRMLKTYATAKIAEEMALFHQMDHWDDRATTGRFGWEYWMTVRTHIKRIMEERKS